VANTFGFGTDTTGFSAIEHSAILKAVFATLRAGLTALPKGVVQPASLVQGNGANFTVVYNSYPDIKPSAVTAPITEGVPPTAMKLGISTNTFTVQQVGAWAKVTDVAAFQSKDPLQSIAVGKIQRLASEYFDSAALTAELLHTPDVNLQGALSTSAILDAKASLVSINVPPVGGAYYGICHPFALRGLEGESSLNGYTQVTSEMANSGDLSNGVVSLYRGVRFITSAAIPSQLGPALPAATVVAATGIFSAAGHGLTAGQAVQFSAFTGGTTGWSLNSDYFVQSVNLAAGTFSVSATRGGATVTGATNGTAIAYKQRSYPVIFMGAGSMAAGDVSTMQFFVDNNAQVGNELGQTAFCGFKAIYGAQVVSLSERASGTGSNDTAVDRIYIANVGDGRSYAGA